MALTREERQLLHQKSKQPTFGSGKPDSNQGNEGDIAYRQVEDSGLVQYVKQNGSWVAVGSQGDMPKTRDVTRTVSSGGGGIGSHNHGEFIKKDGSVAYTGNQSFGSNNITNVGTLDVDGATTLDQVTINTTDGAFAVSGTNPINLTTSGSNDINISSGHILDIDTPIMELDVSRDYTINVGIGYILNVTDAMVVTGSNNMTIQATGTAANTLLIENRNNHGSSFEGIHIKTDSGASSSGFNRILIECDNIAAKGGDYGVDIRSENNIRIRAENSNNGNPTGLLMRATGPIDIGVGSSLTPHSGNERVKIHGLVELDSLFTETDESGDAVPINCSTHSVPFDQLDTPKLMRNFTYKNEGTLSANGYLEIVSAANDDNINGTVWLVTVAFNNGTKEGLSVGYCFRMNATLIDPVDMSNNYVVHYYQDGGTFGAITWDASNGIRYQNLISGSVDVTYKASAQRIQSGNDFS